MFHSAIQFTRNRRDDCQYIVASHLRRGSVVVVAVGQINGGLSDRGPLNRYPNSRPRVGRHNIDDKLSKQATYRQKMKIRNQK